MRGRQGTVPCLYRYRNYYYDTETSLYYLNTRYYDASIGRFINADDISYLGANGDLQGFNLYAYCSNNPVMGYDPMGTWNWKSIVKAIATVAFVATAIALTAVSFGISTPVIVAVTGAAVVSGTMNIVEQVNETPKDQELNSEEVAVSSLAGGTRLAVATLLPDFIGVAGCAAVSGMENFYKESKNGLASKKERDRKFVEGFNTSFLCYSFGAGFDSYFGTKVFGKIFGGEFFGGILNLG